MNKTYAGKVVFVTGGGSGIGQATALTFAREGAKVVITDLSEESLRKTVRLIEESGKHALGLKCDVTKAANIRSSLEKKIETFGRLDVAFNNAGIEYKTKKYF